LETPSVFWKSLEISILPRAFANSLRASPTASQPSPVNHNPGWLAACLAGWVASWLAGRLAFRNHKNPKEKPTNIICTTIK
jgi:hypothetical protein